jgi:hypothetical protein
MFGSSEHDIIRNSDRRSDRKQGFVSLIAKESNLGATSNITIEIHSTKVIQNEVSAGVNSLNVVSIRVKCADKPRIICDNKLSNRDVSPNERAYKW